jgi:hypothetical protein
MTGIISEIVEDAEDLFPPKPGGLVDRHRKRKAAEEAAREDGSDTTTETTGRNKVRAVRTAAEAPNLSGVSTVLLTAAQPVRRLLPRDENRRSAVVLAVDNDVYVTTDPGMAINVAGAATNTGPFYLPAGIAIPIDSQAEFYAACTTTATSSRISVLVNRESA